MKKISRKDNFSPLHRRVLEILSQARFHDTLPRHIPDLLRLTGGNELAKHHIKQLSIETNRCRVNSFWHWWKKSCSLQLRTAFSVAFVATIMYAQLQIFSNYSLVLIYEKLFSLRPIIEMCSVQEMQQVDWELSRELKESPINPALLHVCSPRLFSSALKSL